jgi:hypothetical protein
MRVGFAVHGCVDCTFTQIDAKDVDIGMQITNSIGIQINTAHFEASTAVKGHGVKDLSAKDVTHRFVPTKTRLALIIAGMTHGHV